MSGANLSTTLELPGGHHWVRLTALTPVNCGDTEGTAAVDRPVALDVWHHLPYLPGSGLKGVIAGRWGNVGSDGRLNSRRTDLFGAPDDDREQEGQPSQVIFGDGEPLAFPLVLRDGRRARVVAAATVYRLAKLNLGADLGVDLTTLCRVEAEDGFATAPDVAAALPATALPLRPARFGVTPAALAPLAGDDGTPLILAAPRAAAALWRAAVAEERTLTALDETGRVQAGSLRTVELIPAGAVFLSLVSNLTARVVDLGPAAPIQLGAWEGIGLGYVHAERVVGEGAGAPVGDEPAASPPSGPRPSPPHEVMLRVFQAMEALQARAEAPKVRSAIFDLGPRFSQQGLAGTLAFCLAKAGGPETSGPRRDEPSRDQRAYRWLLEHLLEVTGTQAELHRRTVAALSGEAVLPADFEATRLWLRRYAETLLPREVSDD